MSNPRPILVVAPSRLTRGGITAVVKAYESSTFWFHWNCIWIETHSDRNTFAKLLYFLSSLSLYLFYLPRSRLVHIHLSEPIGALRKSVYAILAFLLRKPVIVHFHSFSASTTIDSSWRPLYRFLFARSRLILVLSQSWKSAVKDSLGDLPIEILHNPSPRIPQHCHAESRQRPYILFAGTLIGRKGYADLIRAYAAISKKHPDWDLVLAGNGEIENARTLAKQLGVEETVRLLGWISNNEKNTQFSQASVFCLPSYAEGFPMALLDAFAYGLPIITTPVGGILDVLENNKSAIIVPPGDIAELSMALDKLLSSKELRSSLSKASNNLAEGSFSLKTICNQLDSIYTSIIGPKT